MIKTRPSILVVSQSLPFSNGMGSELRLRNWILALTRTMDVYLEVITMNHKDTTRIIDNDIVSRCVSFNVTDVSTYQLKKANLYNRFLKYVPELLARWPHAEIKSKLQYLESKKFDAVLVVRLRLLPVWNSINIETKVEAHQKFIDLDDIDSINYMRQLKIGGTRMYGKIGAFLQFVDILKLRSIENEVSKNFDCAFLCSKKDVATLNARTKSKGKFNIIPNCVDMPKDMLFESKRQEFRLLFVGSLSYEPNIDAVRWLVEEILPEVRSNINNKNIVLEVIGRDPPEWITQIEDIELHSNVPSVLPHYQRCNVAIVPLRAAGGTRIKIIEAMSLGRIVISTSIGAEGLEVEAGKHYINADTTLEMVLAIKMVVNNYDLHKQMRIEARQFVESNYSLNAFNNKVDEALASKIANTFE